MKLRAVVIFAFTLTTLAAGAQSSRAGKWPDTMDLTYGYTAIRANAGPGLCGCYLMTGGDAQFEFNRRSGLGVLFDYANASTTNINDSSHNIALTTYLGGVRYALPHRRGFSGYVHGLAGVGHTTTNFTLDDHSTALAYAGGGGVDFRVTRRIELRLLQAELLTTHVPNGVNDRQNQLRFTVGLVYHLNRPGF